MPVFKTLLATCALTLGLTTGASASDQPPITPVRTRPQPLHGRVVRDRDHPYPLRKERLQRGRELRAAAERARRDVVPFPSRRVRRTGKWIHSTAFVTPDSGNAVWGVQVFWPIKAQYIVAYLKDDYSQVIVARDARDYTWVMARTPTVSAADYAALVARVKQLGYSLDDLRKVPQAWPARSQQVSDAGAAGSGTASTASP